jgi:hypothetical protein
VTAPQNPNVQIGETHQTLRHAACCDKQTGGTDDHDWWCRTLDTSSYPIGGPIRPRDGAR